MGSKIQWHDWISTQKCGEVNTLLLKPNMDIPDMAEQDPTEDMRGVPDATSERGASNDLPKPDASDAMPERHADPRGASKQTCKQAGRQAHRQASTQADDRARRQAGLHSSTKRLLNVSYCGMLEGCAASYHKRYFAS